jgi:NADH:ubiquinone oxidoreductase subunit
MNLGLQMLIYFKGRLVGRDSAGNRYYLEKRSRRGLRARRWVLYPGLPEASAVPPEWHSWIHHTTAEPISDVGRHPWQKAHLPNATGTVASYRPAGHDYKGGHRARADGDYEAWTPGE